MTTAVGLQSPNFVSVVLRMDKGKYSKILDAVQAHTDRDVCIPERREA